MMRLILVDRYQIFWGTGWLHLQGGRKIGGSMFL